MDASSLAYSIDRFAAGLDGRLQVAKPLLARANSVSAPIRIALNGQLSLFHAALSRRRIFSVRSRNPQAELLWYVLNTSCSQTFLAQQRSYLFNIGSHEEQRILTPLAIGRAFGSPELPVPNFANHSDEDYSLLVQSHLISERANFDNERFYSFLSSFVNDLRKTIGLKSVRRLADLQVLLHQLGTISDISNINNVRRAIAQTKKVWWPIIGADFFSALQALCDTSFKFDAHSLHNTIFLLRLWRSDSFAIKLIAVRALCGFAAEKEYLQKNWLDVEDRIHPRLASHVRASVFDTSLPELSFWPSDYMTRTLALAFQVGRSIARRSSAELKYWIIRAYEHDPSIVGFFSWDKIRPLIATPWLPVDASSAFLILLMGEPQVRNRFPMVAFTTGRGAFIADLHSLIKKDQKRAPTARLLMMSFRRLSPKARHRVVRELVEKSVLERISNMMVAPQPAIKTLTLDADAKVCALRIDAAREAAALGAISTEEYESVTSDEISQLRMLLFHNIMLFGRVQIEWDAIENYLNQEFKEQVEFLSFSELRGEKIRFPKNVLDSIMRYISRRIALAALVDATDSVDQALSNNLRHGVLVPRFMRAFEDTIPTIYAGPEKFQGWSDKAIIELHGAAGTAIVELRNEVASKIASFMDESLKLSESSGIVASASQKICDLLKSTVLGNRQKNISFHPMAAVIKDLVSEFVSAASAHLDKTVWPEITKEIEAVREVCSTPASKQLIDSLEVNLSRAVEDASRWINIAEDRGKVNEFMIDEIVSVELLSTQASHSQRLRVECRSVFDQDGKIRQAKMPHLIDGAFLGFFQETVHNLVSNAFKYSGMGLQTRLELELRISETGFVLRAINSVSLQEMQKVMKNYAQTVRHATADAPKRAKLDKVSGFQRIKVMGRRLFKANLIINIPPLSIRKLQFLAEIQMRTNLKILKT